MGYKVIRFFTDLKDNNHPYQVGDNFPRKGAVASAQRINELATSENRQKRPLIEYVEDVKSEVKVEEVAETASAFTKTEINRMPLNELKALAAANGVEGWNDMTGAELKRVLIKKFNL